MKVIHRMLKERRRSLKNKSVPFSYINGKIVYRERRFTTIDSDEIMDKVKSLSREIGR
jgi:hypothetical protein